MINIGIIGVGGIAGVHLASYSALKEQANVVALCDIMPERSQGKSEAVTNLGQNSGVKVHATAYANYHDLIADSAVQAVDICLPTDLHAEVAIAALESGKHVLCEKPMALTIEQCDRMIAAADASNRILMIAQCIRFWPEYAYVKALAQNGTYGKITDAVFSRLSPLPTWTADGWYLQAERSGGAVQDLHIHDVDYLLYLLGKPQTVSVQARQQQERIDFVSVNYHFGDDLSVRIDGGWDYPPSLPFRMSFLIRFEGATVEWDSLRGPLKIYPANGEVISPELVKGDAYQLEIEYFLHCIATNTKPIIVTPEDARESVRLVKAEVEALRVGKTVCYQ